MSKRRMTFDEWCKASGLHYTELAAKFGLSVSQVYRIRANGTKRPETAERIEQITGGKVQAMTLLGICRKREGAGA
jgi:transcriptional regulator with XRE-family HTH domain